MVFANAGVAEFAALGKITEEHFDKLFDINVKGTLFTVQKALPLLKDGGSIILNGSVAGVKGTAAFGVYGATKAALPLLRPDLDFGSQGSSYSFQRYRPGPMDTPVIDGQPADAIARIVSTIPMGRMGDSDKLPRLRFFWRRMIPALLRVLNCLWMAVEGKSNRETLHRRACLALSSGMLQKACHRVQDLVRKRLIRYGSGQRHRSDARALKVRIAFDLAARLFLPGSKPAIKSRSALT